MVLYLGNLKTAGVKVNPAEDNKHSNIDWFAFFRCIYVDTARKHFLSGGEKHAERKNIGTKESRCSRTYRKD